MKQGNTRLARRLLWIAGYMDALTLFTLCCAAASHGAGILWIMLLPLGFTVFALAYAYSQGLWFELGKERVWKRTCIGIGFKSEGRSYRNGLYGAYVKGETKIITPLLREVHGTHDSWTGLVTFFDGQTIEQYNAHADAYALAFQVPHCSFDVAESGLIRIRAGKVPVPAPYEFQAGSQPGDDWREPDAGARVPPPLPDTPLSGGAHAVPVIQPVYAYAQPAALAYERALLQNVPMALDIDGNVWSMPIEETHVLIAARTGGGKGSFLWTLVLRLAPAWRAGLVRFWGCDPKRLELAIGREWWEHYADIDVTMVELLEQAVSEMYEVGNQLKGKARRFTASQQTPLNLLVIDELGYLSSLLTDRKLQTRADNAIKTLLTQGRSNGYAVVGAVQDPRKATVEYRDLFPIRIAGGLNEAKMVDLILGEGMHDAGALCEQIPLGRQGAGVAYVLDAERAMQSRLVRAAWVSDETIRDALNPMVRLQAEAYETEDEYTGYGVPQVDFDGQPI